MKQIIPFKKDIVLKTRVSEVTSLSIDQTIVKSSTDFIEGSFGVSGTYKMLETSVNKEEFKEHIPYEIMLDDDYIESSISVEICDFYHEIINNDILRLNIELEVTAELEKGFTRDEDLVEASEKNQAVYSFDFTEFDDDYRDDETLESDEEKEEELESLYKVESKIINFNDVKDNAMAKDTHLEMHNEPTLKEVQKDKVMMPSMVDVNNLEIKSIFSNLNDDEDNFVSYYVHIFREGESLEDIYVKYSTTHESISRFNDTDNIKYGHKIIIPTTKCLN